MYIFWFPPGSDGKEPALNAGGMSSIPGSWRSPREGNGNPLQYSCQEKPIDWGAWQLYTVNRITKSQTRLSDYTFHFHFMYIFIVQFSCSVVSNSLQPHGLQKARPPCPSPTPRVYSNSCPSSWWCHPTISSSVILFSSCLQSFPASGSFPVKQFFASGGQSIGVSASASVLPVNIQDWFPLGLTCLTLLQSTGLSRVFSNTTVQKHQFFGTQFSL